MIAVPVLFVIGTVAAGAWSDIDKLTPPMMLRLPRGLPVLTLPWTTAIPYPLLRMSWPMSLGAAQCEAFQESSQ